MMEPEEITIYHTIFINVYNTKAVINSVAQKSR